MRIELLLSENDITEFIDYLYSMGYTLCNDRDGVFSKELAKAVLYSDLYRFENFYYLCLGNNPDKKMLFITSCGMASLPWGNSILRRAGLISENYEYEPFSEAHSAFLRIKQFIRKNYVYDYYHKEAKMKCFFGPFYLRQQEEAAVFGERYAGSLNIFIKNNCGIDIGDELVDLKAYENIEIRNYYSVQNWYNQDVTWIGVQFLYTGLFNINWLVNIGIKIMNTPPIVNESAVNFSIVSPNFHTGVSIENPISILFLVEKPFFLNQILGANGDGSL